MSTTTTKRWSGVLLPLSLSLLLLLLLFPTPSHSTTYDLEVFFSSPTRSPTYSLASDGGDTVVLALRQDAPGLEVGAYQVAITLELISPADPTFGLLAYIAPNGSSPSSTSSLTLPAVPSTLSGLSCPECITQACSFASMTQSVIVSNTSESVVVAVQAPDTTGTTYSISAVARNQSSFQLASGVQITDTVECASIQYYSLDWNETEGTVVVQVTSNATQSDASQNGVLFVKHGSPPTASDYDLRLPFLTDGIVSFSSQGAVIGDKTWDRQLQLGTYYIGVAADVALFEYRDNPRGAATSSPVCCKFEETMQYTITVFTQDVGQSYVLWSAVPPGAAVAVAVILLIALFCRLKTRPPNVSLYGRYVSALTSAKYNTSAPVSPEELAALKAVLIPYPNRVFGETAHWAAMMALGIAVNGPVLILNYQNAFDATQGGEASVCRYNFKCKRDSMVLGLGVPAFNHVWAPTVYIVLGLFLIMWVGMTASHRVPLWVRMVHYRQPHYPLFQALGVSLVNTGVGAAAYNLCPNRFTPVTDFFFLTVSVMWLGVIALLRLAAFYGTSAFTLIDGRHTLSWVLAFVSGVLLAACRVEEPMKGWNYAALGGTAFVVFALYTVYHLCLTPAKSLPYRVVLTHVSQYWVRYSVFAFIQALFILIGALTDVTAALLLLLDVSLLVLLVTGQYVFVKATKVHRRVMALLNDDQQAHHIHQAARHDRILSSQSTKDVTGARDRVVVQKGASFAEVREELRCGPLTCLMLGLVFLTILVVVGVEDVRDVAATTADASNQKNQTCLFWFYDFSDVLHLVAGGAIMWLALFLFHVDDDILEPTQDRRADPIADTKTAVPYQTHWDRQEAAFRQQHAAAHPMGSELGHEAMGGGSVTSGGNDGSAVDVAAALSAMQRTKVGAISTANNPFPPKYPILPSPFPPPDPSAGQRPSEKEMALEMSAMGAQQQQPPTMAGPSAAAPHGFGSGGGGGAGPAGLAAAQPAHRLDPINRIDPAAAQAARQDRSGAARSAADAMFRGSVDLSKPARRRVASNN